tara:strand:+ start:1354 stop:3234 length:1881 start_codon:yes stop_codon:yes gene_type:complete
MRKLLYVFLSILIYTSNLPAQSIDGNYELDSLHVLYIIEARDVVQTGNDGNQYTTTYDDSAASYDVTIGWPNASDTSLFDFSLPYFNIGDTMGVFDVPLGSPAALAAFGLGLNTDFSDDGTYVINEGSVYPTTNTQDCVTSQVFLPIQDAGTWTDGGYDPLVTGNSVAYGWGIIQSGVFATFNAPDMVNHVYGTDYGVGTAMPNWGYITVNYTDNTYTTPDGLNIGWEAHDGVEANIGVVSDGDPFFVQAEADLGLVNGMLGRSAIPVDSVTIGAVAQQAAAAGITINIPTENPPYMAGGEGIDLDGDGTLDGATSSEWFYVFDPVGDLLGGGDGVPFSGDEGLQFTGYYATWNVLITMNGIGDGVAAAVAGGAIDPTTGAPNIPMIVDSVLSYTLYYWDMSDATVDAVVAAGIPAAATQQVTDWLTAGYTLEQVGSSLLPYILGAVTNAQVALGGALTYADGSQVVVDDSGHDLSLDDFQWEYTDYGLWNNRGGRLWVQSYANCFPATWSQYVNSHWTYMGALSTVDNDNITANKFELKGNYPNPFNPTTKIRFTNDRASNVKVTVYSLKGEKVATIMNKQVNSGTYDVSWNGKNTSGKVVPTGMYLYDIESDGRRLQGKMLFLK